MKDTKINRPTLGPFMSVVCFQYLYEGALDLAGDALIVDAGRQRGHDLINELGVAGTSQGAAQLQAELGKALGIDGTRLCLVESVTEESDGSFLVHTNENASPTYTLGVLIGAINAITGKTFIGKKKGGDKPEEHVYRIEPL